MRTIVLNPLPSIQEPRSVVVEHPLRADDSHFLGEVLIEQETISLISEPNSLTISVPWGGESGVWEFPGGLLLNNGADVGRIWVKIIPHTDEGVLALATYGDEIPLRDLEVDLETGEIISSGVYVGSREEFLNSL